MDDVASGPASAFRVAFRVEVRLIAADQRRRLGTAFRSPSKAPNEDHESRDEKGSQKGVD